ncbi:hypothetical protein [Campylobacter sp. RM9328]|uniref:hypothetical protein n=1 Tax=Campylobacter sp. RM9328 TaxID=1705720 RepID=UPI0014757DC0|nr:hypothetical protein [Campylobacter sp. RM9328]
MYGITEADKVFLKNKLENQKRYLDNNFLYINGKNIPYSHFYFSSWHNSNRYIAELNNRVSSLNDYAEKEGLKPIFAVLTLPSEYHRQKMITLKSGRSKLVYNKKYINDDKHSVKSGSNKLQFLVRSIMNSKHFRNIPPKQRCYISTKEPHLDGTCHLNLLVFVPEEYLNDCVSAIKSRFLDTHSKVETNINNPTAYIMKYIFKTLDDLRQNPELENLTDITFWYLKHHIRRFTMSKTFVSLEIYRKLNGRIGLISLTKNYNKGLITVIIDPETKKPVQIFDEFGELWQKIKIPKVCNNTPYKMNDKNISKRFKELQLLNYIDELFGSDNKNIKCLNRIPINRMSNFELVNYYHNLDLENINLQHLGYVENILLERDLNCFTHINTPHDLNNLTANDFIKRGLNVNPS